MKLFNVRTGEYITPTEQTLNAWKRNRRPWLIQLLEDKKEKATCYYSWGTEPTGFVSVGFYDHNEVWIAAGLMQQEEAVKRGLTAHCPYR